MELALADLRKALRNHAATLGLPGLWRWWLAELAPLVPALPRTALQRWRLRPVVAFEDGVAVLWDLHVVDRGVALVEAARIPLAGDAAAVAHAGRTAIEALPQRVYGGMLSAARVVVALARGQVLRKQLVLPAAIEENLREALAYDIDRHTPFRADQLYFDAAVVGRDVARREIRVDWAAALKSSVDQARRHAESWGATVVAVTPETLDAATAANPGRWSKLNLLPDEERSERVFWRRWQFWVPVALLALGALAVVALPIWQKRDYVIRLMGVTEQARVQAAAADALRQQLDQAVGDYNFALDRKYTFPSTVQLLEDVSRLLPVDTWLTQLEVKSMPKGKEPHREIVLRGESANAGTLVSKLEESKLVEQAAPRSPMTKIQPGPGEVFDLGAQLRALSRPASIVLARAEPKPAVPAAAPAPNAADAAAAPAGAAPASTAVAPAAAPGSAPAPASAAAPAGGGGGAPAPRAPSVRTTNPAAGTPGKDQAGIAAATDDAVDNAATESASAADGETPAGNGESAAPAEAAPPVAAPARARASSPISRRARQ
jgi:general secretion pathway protein L